MLDAQEQSSRESSNLLRNTRMNLIGSRWSSNIYYTVFI